MNRHDVTIRNIRKTFGGHTVLHDIDLDIAGGEFLTLLGGSGSGKTTLLRIIAGFTSPDAGQVLINGLDVIPLPPQRRNIGMVFQGYALFPHMTVAANVAYPLEARRLPKPAIRDRVRWALDLMQLGDYGPRMPSSLSGGQRQRVALARALVFEPGILLMDEPLSALDKSLRETMQIEMRKIHERIGATTIFVTHDQREALTMSDRIAVMSEGRIEQVASPVELYNRPATAYVAAFVGESTLVPVMVKDGRVWLGEHSVAADVALRSADRMQHLVLRPEWLQRRCADNRPFAISFTGRVRSRVFQGDSILMEVQTLEDHHLSVREVCRPGMMATLPGENESVSFGLAADHVVVVPDGGASSAVAAKAD